MIHPFIHSFSQQADDDDDEGVSHQLIDFYQVGHTPKFISVIVREVSPRFTLAHVVMMMMV